jgi:hypothetical protein
MPETFTTRYTLSTESLPGLPALVARHFDAFTLREQTGYWRGQEEKSADIILLADASLETRNRVIALAEDINLLHGQDAVLVQVDPVTARLITTRPAAVALRQAA